jgi:hypothetical protein
MERIISIQIKMIFLTGLEVHLTGLKGARKSFNLYLIHALENK